MCGFFFFLFFLKGMAVLDPDFGWHLKMGEYILHHGIPGGDPFSYTMPSYPFVDHEWLTNVGFYLLYSRVGYVSLALVFAFFATVLIGFLVRDIGGRWAAAAALAIFCILFPFAGVRPQIITWLGMLIYLHILTRRRDKDWLAIPLMVLWVNLHGGFFVGVGIFGVYALSRILTEKRVLVPLAIKSFLLILATCINPYGWRVWWEVFMQLTDSRLRFSIAEWMPAFSFLNVVYWAYAGFVSSLVLKYRRNIPLFWLLLYSIFFAAGLMSMRNIPLWVIVSIPPLILGTSAFLREARRGPGARRRLKTALRYFTVIAALLLVIQLVLMGLSSVDERTENKYPVGAVRYLKAHRLEGRIIALYGWGGYLIWQMPGEKTFVDGRMPSWRRGSAPGNESRYAIDEYAQFFDTKENMLKIAKKYGIKYVLVPSTQPEGKLEKAIREYIFGPDKKINPVKSLRTIYSDRVATVKLLP